ncbi:NTPase KAP [Methylobacterium terricola]|uniref:NTPase KAP n=1 Tax=Methylobacterium terricola TaxID=2583531 RepID=A0A5C4LBC0_9HYPH|nr:Qat anti-phage system ATPase QatA [Methylobacterium terricola]TNC09186.1 NTPase KAP [Methylobacterium terricola]
MAGGEPASLAYLSDHETKVDLLNNEAIAATVLKLIKQKSEHPITIGVHGDWGAGKSSVLKMVETTLEQDAGTCLIKFNGWQFQGFEDAKIALIEGVVNGLIENRSLRGKAEDVIERIRENIDVLKAAKMGGKLAFTFFTGLPSFGAGEVFEALTDKIKEIVTDPKERKQALEQAEALKKEGEKSGKPSVPHEIAEFRKSFEELIARASVERIVVLVDDLDRCLPETAIETLEAIRLFVFLDKTAFVVGADERMIEYAVGRHFPNLPKMEDSQGYARAYLEKLLQVPFRIPALGETETRIYVTLLLLGSVLGEEEERFLRLLDLGRAALRTPWDGEGIKPDDLKAVLGERPDDPIRSALLTAERISPVLAAGTKGNPRQIKRFLNALNLRLAVAQARGFGTAIEPTRLAKIMLAEMFLPESVFTQMATLVAKAPDGVSPLIARIEAAAEEAATPASAADPPAPTPDLNATDDLASVLEDWKLRPEVLDWARIKPKLGGESLKPYLFVIKDRRNYLAGVAPLSAKLKDIVARLTGGDLNAANVTAAVRALTPPEIDAVFKDLRGQLLSTQSLQAKPPAMGGLAVLTQAHPGLQVRYVEVLAELPIDRLGPGVVSVHGFIQNDDALRRLNAVFDTWARSDNLILKRAVEAMRTAGQRRGRRAGRS